MYPYVIWAKYDTQDEPQPDQKELTLKGEFSFFLFHIGQYSRSFASESAQLAIRELEQVQDRTHT